MTDRKTTQAGDKAIPWVAVYGSGSAVGRACAAQFARCGYGVHLLERRVGEAKKTAADLNLRFGVPAKGWAFDALDLKRHPAVWKSLSPMPHGVFVAFGWLGDLERSARDGAHAFDIIQVNFTGVVTALTPAVVDFESAVRGGDASPRFIAVISSVAGDRGRASNLVYGSAKAGLTAWLSGLRQRFTPLGIPVTTLIPGYMRTPMTRGMNLPGPLTAGPEEAAQAMVGAVLRRKAVVYVKPVWRWVMAIIAHIPESVFRKLKF